MADSKISALTAQTTLASTDMVPLATAGGATKKITGTNLSAGVAALGVVAADAVWDAAGDLAVGSGANTAAKLVKGTPGQILTSDGSTLAWTGNPLFSLAPTGAISENFSRYAPMAGGAPSSGVARAVAIWLPKGQTITALNVVCGSTGESGGSHAWAALYDNDLALLRQSTDETGATAVGASAAHTFTLSSTFDTTYAGLYYVAVNVVATTTPALLAATTVHVTAGGLTPVIGGNSASTGLTDTAPNPLGALTAITNPFYCYVT